MSSGAKAVLMEHQELLSSVLKDHDIDSFKVPLIEADHIADYIEELASSFNLYSPLKNLWESLQQKVHSLRCALSWQHIANAVRHEMNNVIAQHIVSSLSDLGDLKEGSGDALISAVKTKRALTVSEMRYLRALVQRATATITLTLLGDDS